MVLPEEPGTWNVAELYVDPVKKLPSLKAVPVLQARWGKRSCVILLAHAALDENLDARAVRLNEAPLLVVASRKGSVVGAVQLQDVRNAPGVVWRLDEKNGGRDVANEVLRKQALPLLSWVLSYTFRVWRVYFNVGELHEILLVIRLVVYGTIISREVLEDAGVWRAEDFRALRENVSDILSPSKGSKAAC